MDLQAFSEPGTEGAESVKPLVGDEWLIHELRTRRRRDGWAQIMVAAAERLEQLTQQPESDTP